MKTSFRGLSLIASLAVLALAAPAFAAIYAPIEDAELLRRADTVVLARASDSVVVATPGGLPETRTTFAVVDTFTGKDQPALEVVVPGGELPSGLALVLDGVPRFTPGAIYILALNARGDGTYVPTELGLGAFDIVRDEAGRDYATRSMFRGEKVAVREREADGSLVERREPLRELAAFASYVGAELFREAPVTRPAGLRRDQRGGGAEAGAPGRRLGPVGRPLVPERRPRDLRRQLHPLPVGQPGRDGPLLRREPGDGRAVGCAGRRRARARAGRRDVGERPEQRDQLHLRRRRDGDLRAWLGARGGDDPDLLRQPLDVRRPGGRAR